MRVLIDALSVTNISGRHVLLGHLGNLAHWTQGQHEYVVLFHDKNRDICCDLGQNVTWIKAPAWTSHWMGRSLWERIYLASLVKKQRIDFRFTPAGTVVANLPIPQVSFAQNPWALVDDIHRSPAEHVKAKLQRHNYRQAMQHARLMVFNSEFMRRVYRENAGIEEKSSLVVYQGIADETHAAAEHLAATVPRCALQIISVSVMAPHKGVETLVEALHLLHKRFDLPATLVLVGGWPNRAYELRIRRQVEDVDMGHAVEFRGHVSQDELHRLYAESRVFSLMSWCESFGIPAVEAEAFGTPVVSSNCCAMPEVDGAGGVYPSPGNAIAAAEALAKLLTDDEYWEAMSAAAYENAQKYRWETCSRPLLKMFDIVAEGEE